MGEKISRIGIAVVAEIICSERPDRVNAAVMNSVCSVRIVETAGHGWHTRPIARRKDARPGEGEISRKPYERRSTTEMRTSDR
jgi:hypothetical protein